MSLQITNIYLDAARFSLAEASGVFNPIRHAPQIRAITDLPDSVAAFLGDLEMKTRDLAHSVQALEAQLVRVAEDFEFTDKHLELDGSRF